MRSTWALACWLTAIPAGLCWADGPAAGEVPPFATPGTRSQADLQRRFEDLDTLRGRMQPPAVDEAYHALYREALREYGPTAYEPYAALDRLAGYYADRGQVAGTDLARQARPAEAARGFLDAMRATRREIVEGLGRSEVAGWRKQGEVAKQEGAVHLSEGRVDQARTAFDRAAEQFSGHPLAAGYSLAFVRLKQAEIAVAQRRWDDAEAICDGLFRLFHEMDANSLDPLSLDVLEQAEGLAAYHLAYSLARRRADLPGRAAKFAEWNLNAKVHRREVFGRRLATLKAARGGRAAEVWGRLRTVWGRLAGLAVQPAGPGATRARQLEHAKAIRSALAEAKGLAREAARVADPGGAPDEWVTIDRVRAALGPDAVLLDLVGHLDYDFDAPPGVTRWAGARDLAFVIPAAGKGEVRLVDLGDEEGLWRAVDAYVRGMAPTDFDDPAARRAAEAEAARVTRDLGRVLLEPLRPHVGGFRRWVISPYALTWLVPWSTLTDADGTPVVERHATSYVLAGRHLARPAPARDAAAGAPLILAAPEYGPGPAGRGGGPFRPMPETAEEGRAIAPLLEAYAGAAPRVLLGAEAREAALDRSPPPRVLVASTHGYYGGLPDALLGVQSPMLRCGLALTGANRRQPDPGARPGADGVATGLEILAADFRGTDLVVLSACETSYGEFQTSQGLIGLNLAFHLSGARSVLGSLWPVPVDETTELTTAFFGELARGADADEALRRSQVKLIKRLRSERGGAHPWYWAGFVLSGYAGPARAASPPR